ncbi:MAG: signal peptidase I [Clostridia bacterium]|nr:signal peptidase I [Clostridia bacterium]
MSLWNKKTENTEAFEEVEEVVAKSMKREILEWVLCIVIAVGLALLIRQFIFNVVKVDGASMENTLHDKDQLIVWKLGYTPEKGDIIVLHQANHPPYIKRIIATEGQTVDIDFNTHKVYVDGVEIEEPYIKEPTAVRGDVKFPVTVEEDCVFVMGDNRNHSSDSRFSDVGFVHRSEILGKAVFRFWPFSSIKTF